MRLDFSLWLENMTISQFMKTDPRILKTSETINLSANYNVLNPEYLNIFKRWLAYNVIHNDPNILNKIRDKDIIFAMPSELKSKFNNTKYTIQDLENDNNNYHAKLSTHKSKSYNEPIRNLDLIPTNGLQWGNLNKDYCEKYGKTMGHCGNSNAKHSDEILTLYDPKTNTHYLTFIINDGILGEMKGRSNTKPNSKFFPNIKQLLLSQYVKAIRGGGYVSENNFTFNDLDEQSKKEILSKKPNINNYMEFITPDEALIAVVDVLLNIPNRLLPIDGEEEGEGDEKHRELIFNKAKSGDPSILHMLDQINTVDFNPLYFSDIIELLQHFSRIDPKNLNRYERVIKILYHYRDG